MPPHRAGLPPGSFFHAGVNMRKLSERFYTYQWRGPEPQPAILASHIKGFLASEYHIHGEVFWAMNDVDQLQGAMTFCLFISGHGYAVHAKVADMDFDNLGRPQNVQANIAFALQLAGGIRSTLARMEIPDDRVLTPETARYIVLGQALPDQGCCVGGAIRAVCETMLSTSFMSDVRLHGTEIRLSYTGNVIRAYRAEATFRPVRVRFLATTYHAADGSVWSQYGYNTYHLIEELYEVNAWRFVAWKKS